MQIQSPVWDKTMSRYFDADRRTELANSITVGSLQTLYGGHSRGPKLPYSNLCFEGRVKPFLQYIKTAREAAEALEA